MKKIITLIIFILTFYVNYGQIVSFDFQGNIGDEVTANSNFNDLTLGVSTISRGSGLIANNNNNSFNSQGWSTIDIADAVTGNDYLEFTISAPIAGFQFDIASINFDIQRSATGLRGVALRSSLDGFATNIDSEMAIADIGGTQNISFNVSQLNNTTAITYRLYGFSEASGGGGRIEGPGNNIEVFGLIKSDPPILCRVSDDFNALTLGSEWTEVGGNSSIVNNELTIVSAGASGLDYVFQNVSSAYNTNLGSSSDIVTWEFNMRKNVGNPSGFNSGQTGGAFILGSTDSDITQGNGYAVVLGGPGANDEIRLVSYTGGIDANSNLTDVIAAGTDFENSHVSIRVVYSPLTNIWELFVRDDGDSFNNPVSIDASSSRGTAVNTTHTNLNLDFIAFAWNHGAQNTATVNYNNLCISTAFTCATTTTWDGTNWDNGVPTLTSTAIIDANYNTITNGNFTACSLIVNTGATLDIANPPFPQPITPIASYVEVENDITVNTGGTLTVQTRGNLVQIDDASIFTNNGTSQVLKVTPVKLDWFYYTYWSAPVSGLTVDDIYPVLTRRFRFGWDAANYRDVIINATGAAGADGIDDDNNAFRALAGTDDLIPGIGYAITEDENGTPPFPRTTQFTFQGPFNNGPINVSIFNDAATVDPLNNGAHYHFLGNPYPSAISFDDFQTANASTIGPLVYYWSQATLPDSANPGNQGINFNQNDYAIYMISMGTGIAGASGVIPNEFIPSGQGFFVPSVGQGTAIFNNSMRATAVTPESNDIFFGIEQQSINLTTSTSTSNETSSSDRDLLWLDLTSNNGVFNQILIGYVDGATDANDGLAYDATRILPSELTSILYTFVEGEDTKLAIQGKDPSGLDETEIIALGFDTNISAENNTTYSLSIAQFEGSFFENTTIFLRDNLLDITHDLSASEYDFTSEIGVFKDRFEIQFISSTLSSEDDILLEENNSLAIIELDNGDVQFRVSDNLEMESVRIIDLTGRTLYDFDANGNNTIFSLSNLNRSIYIAQVKLTNGIVLTKKALKTN
ncbi:T9SS C-terminal target domain-containing protein [Flavobacteriaceae bacterium AU392]|nr:T9SS C-terminal target domain-containing protein [Flavobacteriaceae bacterium]RKM84682.1 T9SS C-terminal target domain-containing protein [Flavobacteriaceae bacterium AU392]